MQLGKNTKKSLNSIIIKTYVFKSGYFGQALQCLQDVDVAKVLDVVKNHDSASGDQIPCKEEL